MFKPYDSEKVDEIRDLLYQYSKQEEIKKYSDKIIVNLALASFRDGLKVTVNQKVTK